MLNKNMSFKSSYAGGVVIQLIRGKLFEDVNGSLILILIGKSRKRQKSAPKYIGYIHWKPKNAHPRGRGI